MRETFKSLPKDPAELRAVSELMAAEIKSQAYQIESNHPIVTACLSLAPWFKTRV